MQQHVEHAERIAALEARMDHVAESQKDILAKLDQTLAAQEKYKGFWGAVLLVASALWAAFTFFFKPHN